MKIIVCVKAVKTELVYPNEIRNEELSINPYDLYAITKCVALKKSVGCELICLCMGPKGAEYVLAKAVAMGADQAYLLNDSAFIGSDTLATTYVLGQAITMLGDVSIVACGEKAIDGETGQVIPGLAQRLGYSCIIGVEELIDSNSGKLTLQRIDRQLQIRQKLIVDCPVVLSFNDFLLKQPNVNLLALKKAKRQGVIFLNAEDIKADEEKCGTKGSKTCVTNIKKDLIQKATQTIQGTIEEKAKMVLEIVGGGLQNE